MALKRQRSSEEIEDEDISDVRKTLCNGYFLLEKNKEENSHLDYIKFNWNLNKERK